MKEWEVLAVIPVKNQSGNDPRNLRHKKSPRF